MSTAPMVTKEDVERFEAESRAFRDMADRVARDDPDWGYYLEGQPRPRLPWWRRVLHL